MKLFATLLGYLLTVAIGLPSAIACPLCLAPSQTWAEMIEAADVVLLTELVMVDDGSAGRRPFAVFEIIEIHKGKQHVGKAKTIRIDDYVYGKKGDQFLVKAAFTDASTPEILETFAAADTSSKSDANSASITKVSASTVAESKSKEAADRVLTWDSPEPVTKTAWRYVTEAPNPDTSAKDRLRYFLTFMEHKDELIASDAWGEFAKSEYDAIKSLSSSFDNDKLRTWISSEETSPERLSLYGLMLGMSGSKHDAAFLQEQIGMPNGDDVRFGTEGLMGGLLVLSGEEGLRFLEDSRLKNSEVATFEVYSVVQALQFIWNHESTAFNKPRLRQAMHPLLQREELREIAIIDLARWEDWTLVSELSTVYDDCRDDDERTTRAIVGYLLVFLKANGKEPATATSELDSATALLAKIRSDNPRLVKMAERQLR